MNNSVFVPDDVGARWAEAFRHFDVVYPLFEQRGFSKHEALLLIMKAEEVENLYDIAFSNLTLARMERVGRSDEDDDFEEI